jgi:hypothetical protein
LQFCKSKATLNIPPKIDDGEKIVRTIFSPINLSNDLKTLKINAFRPPADSEELSVNRIDYTTADFCKQISKENDKPESIRSYFGFALLYANQIKDSGSDIVYSPLVNNKFHSDIKIGYTVIRGEQLPAEFNYKIKKLTSLAKLFEDPNPNSDTWDGDEII